MPFVVAVLAVVSVFLHDPEVVIVKIADDLSFVFGVSVIVFPCIARIAFPIELDFVQRLTGLHNLIKGFVTA